MAGLSFRQWGESLTTYSPNIHNVFTDFRETYVHTTLLLLIIISFQLRSVLTNSDVYTTFAVTDTYLPLYKQLSNQLPRSGCSLLKEDNIVPLITEFTKVSVTFISQVFIFTNVFVPLKTYNTVCLNTFSISLLVKVDLKNFLWVSLVHITLSKKISRNSYMDNVEPPLSI